ncbi:uncharacterized protein N7459_007421 [Penicillium hispanicum]|uniref:uncharacterized protein n=1 Tax=Penicillium hispanicum TaxID=1080232 RepID=UPI00253FD451|nr:uncharacterized protein N7459_007421 [Penicillium hispanicum]KAJ5578457.1 hypothetical protein N7459_007421 [Penicillium hispanicum]
MAPEVNVDNLLARLTLDEKISLLAGHSTWRTTGIPRLGIPPLKVSDGPSGARGQVFGDGVPAAFLPSGVSLGATWDEQLLFEMGRILAEETKSKSASVILAPTMCIQRHPLGGRNFESFSEDPYLTGKLATAHIRGVQSRGIGATPKHYAANDQETDRFHSNSVVPTRALREVYLRPFQMVIRDADPWCIMTAYNRVNGFHCDESTELLDIVLREEWQWEGLTMSDWGGAHDGPQTLRAGLDLEMPGPPKFRTLDKVKGYMAQGEVGEKEIDRSVKRVLHLLHRANRFEDASDREEVTLDNPSHREKLLNAAQAGVVLLKNEKDALPLNPAEHLKRLAIVGPNAQRVVAGGGGSSYIKAPYWTSVDESMTKAFENTGTEIVRSVGAKVNRYLPMIPTNVAFNPDTGEGGGAIDWYDSHDLTGNPVESMHTSELYYINFGNFPPSLQGETGFGFRVRAIIRPLTTGTHSLSLASIGPSKLFIDGKLMVSEDGDFEGRSTLFFTYGSDEHIFTYDMVAGQEYKVEIEYLSHDRQLSPDLLPRMDPMEDKFQGIRLGYEELDPTDLPREAANKAGDSDACIVVVGRDREWETEGQDIPLFELPGEQIRLIEEVSAVCSRVIVVIQAGTPVKLDPWINEVQAVVFGWYQGQELGNAAASVLCGEFNPSGRLPVTYPSHLEDCPSFSSFPGENHEIQYSEGIYVGGRWWDLLGKKPMYPIGYGLSYNTFSLQPKIQNYTMEDARPIQIPVGVIHNGDTHYPGRQTVILWCQPVGTVKGALKRPVKQICGFAKSPLLESGHSCTVEISVTPYELGVYNSEKKSWEIDSGSQFHLLIGPNANETVHAGTLLVRPHLSWVHRI